MSEQNYQVTYTIDVEASQGAKQLGEFASSVSKLTQARLTLQPAVEHINQMIKGIDEIFYKNGKKRDYNYTFSLKTDDAEKKLERIKTALTEIQGLAKKVNVIVNPGEPLKAQAIKANANKLLSNKTIGKQKEEAEKTASAAVKTIQSTQAKITKAIGKINGAMQHFEKTREFTIKTDKAKTRLNEVLGLLQKIKVSATGIALGGVGMKGLNLNTVPYAPVPLGKNVLSEKEFKNLQKNLFKKQQQLDQKLNHEKAKILTKQNAAEKARIIKENELLNKRNVAEQARLLKNRENQNKKNAAFQVKDTIRNLRTNDTYQNSKQRAAINRLQYSKGFNYRSLPFMYMLNGYMAYGMLKSEVGKAVEYANLMESAKSILRVADTDLSTFENRFDSMSHHIRKIGVETKFTAVEVAGAAKYLAMAGMDIETINKSMKAISNLALIGDNDISIIADLATNIMAGYDIKSDSMISVADNLASTVSRSNVNIIEMAESFKMSAGYMRMAGIEFSETAAAIGILGNAGIKATMAGTSLRAMAVRFAKTPKEAKEVMNRMGIKFTEKRDIYGKQVEQLRPLADILEELKTKGATLEDMQIIFGKIGGNAAMMLLKNYDKLRQLTTQNLLSHGLSDELALVKQNTTKGLWYQMTSQFSESFMQSYEMIEPQIQSMLRNFLNKFKSKEFAQGITTLTRTILDLFGVLGKIGNWFIRNFHWIEPLIFTKFVATKIFKLAGAITNLGIALGFLGKQSITSSALQTISGIVGTGGASAIKNLSFANKRTIVSTLQAAGIKGKGAMSSYIASGLGASAIASKGIGGLFSTQVATGSGLTGAGASLAAIGTGAIAATAGISVLLGALGWVAYKTWKVKKAKDAVLEDIESNKKYHYPSIQALHDALQETYTMAIKTKSATDSLTGGKTIKEASGVNTGAFTSNWWGSLGSMFVAATSRSIDGRETYRLGDAYQDDIKESLEIIAQKDKQQKINSAWDVFGKMKDPMQVAAFIGNLKKHYGISDDNLDKELFIRRPDGTIYYKKGLEDMDELKARLTPHYAKYINEQTLPKIQVGAEAYQQAISSYENAKKLTEIAKFDYDILHQGGFYRDENGYWTQKTLNKNASEEERKKYHDGQQNAHFHLVNLAKSLRKILGGSENAAANVMDKAGFLPYLYANRPDYLDNTPWDANDITNSGADDKLAGGNYSGTGKLSSATPKQVIVKIENLMSIETIKLLNSKEGNQTEIKDLKEQLAQALIDVVHDFDASWNHS